MQDLPVKPGLANGGSGGGGSAHSPHPSIVVNDVSHEHRHDDVDGWTAGGSEGDMLSIEQMKKQQQRRSSWCPEEERKKEEKNEKQILLGVSGRRYVDSTYQRKISCMVLRPYAYCDPLL